MASRWLTTITTVRAVATAILIALPVATVVAMLALAVDAAPARAAIDYPVCLRVYGDPTYDECAYTTMSACRRAASGRAADCFVNPFYGQRGTPAVPLAPHTGGRTR